MSESETRRLLRRPAYARYFAIVTISRMAGTMFNVSGVVLILQRTGSLSLAGLVAACATLPGAVTGPVLGAWLDVAPSRRRLIVLDRVVTHLALIALLVFAGHTPDWVLPIIGVAYGITSPLSFGGFASVMPEIAGQELIDMAYTFEAAAVNGAFIVGPALAGTIVAATSAATAIVVQLGVGLVITIAIALDATFDLRPQLSAVHERIRDAVREGVASLWRIPALRANFATFTVYVTAWGMLVVAFPAYALSVGAHASAAGYMWAAISLGSMVSAFALRAPALRLAPRVLIGGSFLVMGAIVGAWPLADDLAAALALVLLAGLFDGPSFVALLALRQRATPEHLRGQIFSTAQSLSLAAAAVGTAVAGPFHEAFGTAATLGAVAALLLLSALLALGMREADTSAVPAETLAGAEKLR